MNKKVANFHKSVVTTCKVPILYGTVLYTLWICNWTVLMIYIVLQFKVETSHLKTNLSNLLQLFKLLDIDGLHALLICCDN